MTSQFQVVTMWRGAPLPGDIPPLYHTGNQDHHHLESFCYAHSRGKMFQSGAPDWLSAHPIARVFAMPYHGLGLQKAYKQSLKSTPQAVVLAHWALPSGWIFSVA